MAYPAFPSAGVGNVFTLTQTYSNAATAAADVTKAAANTLPFAVICRGVEGFAQVIGGTTVHTDVDLVVLSGSTTLATLAVVNSSTRSTVPLTATVAAANQKIAAGTVLSFNIDITDGSSPTCDGISVTYWLERAL